MKLKTYSKDNEELIKPYTITVTASECMMGRCGPYWGESFPVSKIQSNPGEYIYIYSKTSEKDILRKIECDKEFDKSIFYINLIIRIFISISFDMARSILHEVPSFPK